MVDVVELGELGVLLLDQRTIGGTGLIYGHIAHHAEDGFQFRQTRLGGLGAGEFLVIERHGAVGVFYGDQRLVEAALGNGSSGTGLTDQRQIIHRVAINAL